MVNWSPTLLNDLMMTPRLEEAQYVIMDTDMAYGEKMVQLGERLTRERGADVLSIIRIHTGRHLEGRTM